jgi:hypothetical protein
VPGEAVVAGAGSSRLAGTLDTRVLIGGYVAG